jgi:tetratricopeptide (TPR) repeat protein
VRPKITQPIVSPATLSALAKTTGDRERQELLRRGNLFREEVVLELNAATQKAFRVNTTSALGLAEAAIAVAHRIGKKNLLAQSLRVKANVLSASGEYQSAIEIYHQALQLFEKARDDEGTARTLTAIIQPHIMLGNYQEAFAAAQRAEVILLERGDERRLARLDNNIGNIYHRQDRFSEANSHYQRAHQRLLPYGDSEELTISLNNMSMCLISMNDFAQAMLTYQRAKELLASRDLPLIRLINDYNIAYLYYLRGDYRRAIAMLKEARVAAVKIDYAYLLALCHLDLSDIYVELNLSEEAQDVAQEGFQLFRKLEIGYEAAKSLTNQAIALGQAGKIKRALELFIEARTLFVREKNEVWPWLIDLYQAIALFQQGRHFEARCLALGAAGFFDKSTLRTKAVLCQLLLAQIAMHTVNRPEAEAASARAVELLRAVDSPILHFQSHFLRGQLFQSQGNLEAAYSAYQQARSELESLRSSLVRDELKISFMKNKTELYERLVELCLGGTIRNTSTAEAFGYIELAKSRSLTESISQRSHSLQDSQSGHSEFVHKIRDLREELNWYQQRIELEQLRPGGNSGNRIEGLHQKAQGKEKELLKVLGEQHETEIGSAVLPVQNQMPLGRIQSALQPEETLLEYFFAGDRILAAVLTRNSLAVVPVTTASRVSDALRLLRFQLSKFQMPSAVTDSMSDIMYRATVAHLSELYKELVLPLRSQLTSAHLVIVPHGILHYLPFHALHDGQEFLLDRYTFSYAPSATVYALCQLQVAKPGSGCLILGVPDPQAPLIQTEVEAVHRALPDSELFLGDPANHQLFAEVAPGKRLIHVATHGNFRPDNPMFSGFRLSDSYVYLYELYQMHLSSELLTLSGCSTGLNVIAAGDELVGLIRGALHAGARSLLLSLWEVNDESTSVFMTSMYQRLREFRSKAEAVAEAAKEVRAEHPHPYFWAPFVLVGKGLNRLFE